MSRGRSQKNPRFGCFTLLMALAIFILMGRLVYLQVLQPKDLTAIADSQHSRVLTLTPERGKIYDRNGSLLAFNIPAVSVVANADSIRDLHAVAARLSPIIGLSYAAIVKKLRSGSGWVELAKELPASVRDRVKTTGLDFVGCRDGLKRSYPKKRIAGQVVGFARSDGTGGYGIELALNDRLAGKPGTAIMQRTGRARMFSNPNYPIRFAEHGDNLVLTIDARYQRFAEEELAHTVAEYDAKGGSVVIMQPETGEVLAICSEPNFDPNDYADYSDSAWKLAAITDQFEPGSTFKPAMLAAMLDTGYKTENDVVFCENGVWNVMGESISDTKKHGKLTARQVLVQSSNIGMAKMAKDFDKRTMHRYAQKFGFGKKTGIELLGEITGTLNSPRDWNPFSQLVFSYGHEIAVTPLQMCAMYCTIANNGFYVSPRIVREIYHNGEPIYYDAAAERHSVISVETAVLLRDFMADVVKSGTGTSAAVDSLEICGKTGTAHMVRTDGRGYSADRYISSFGGFFPKDQPQIVIFVMIKEPKGGYYGGTVAAPCFQRIAKRIVNLEGSNYFMPATTEGVLVDNSGMPNLIGFTKHDAVEVMHNNHYKYRVYGDGEMIVAQEPQPGHKIPSDDFIYLTTNVEYAGQGKLVPVPKVVDLPLRNAVNLLAEQNFAVEVSGNGKVVRQEPKAGKKVNSGEKIRLYCKAAI